MFELHPRLQADTRLIGKLNISSLYLMNDARYPWVILVPEIKDLRELHHLSLENYGKVTEEIYAVSSVMEKCFSPDKMNIGALGNMVPQLHIHIIARFTQDAAWPGPVWGVGDAQLYKDEILADRIATIKDHL